MLEFTIHYSKFTIPPQAASRIAAIIHYSLFKIHHSAAGGQPRSGYLPSTCTALRPMEKSPVVSFDAVILI